MLLLTYHKRSGSLLYRGARKQYINSFILSHFYGIMPYYQAWEEFARAAEKLYLTDPMKVRVVLKYRHCDGNLCIKVTDDAVCLQYKTDQAQDVKKIEKLHGKLMRLMVSKESHSGAMETD
ncbi:signal recognition particle 9 kDa protein [Engraulis encrasicolus]|uniref:signal recognition particle 9 kDa protein n=1 Tax=Engraulis encrasicolus TaxID=184585 RepID=UPI002FCF5C71